MVKVRKSGQARLFSSSFLEAFTRTNPLVHVITYGTATCLFFWLNHLSASFTIMYFALGVLAWTFTEYLVHRFLFHSDTGKFQYLIHGVHHEFPRDKERLMMPPLPGAVLLTLFYGAWYLLVSNGIGAFMAGFTVAYVVYTFIHYIIHTWKPIPGLKFIWTHHHKHHNPAFENKAYGVSSPIWDLIFGTMPNKLK